MAKKLVVQKYGGTSVGNAERIKIVAQNAKKTWEEGNRVIMVVSAMDQETDELLDLIGNISRTPNQRECDMVLHTGEIKSAALTALALQEIGVPAKSYSAIQLGLITTKIHGQAKIKGIKDKEKLLEEAENHILVVAGFQGIAEETMEITTLGRGGSDATAVAIAAALNADLCEIYTDVDGVYAIDPRLTAFNVRRFEKISYDQMLAMAASGAGVLMDRCVKLAQSYGIPIKVLLSPSFGKSTGGTLVTSAGDPDDMEKVISLASVAVKKRVGVVNISDIPNIHGQAAAIFEKIEANIIDIAQGQGEKTSSISILLNEEDVKTVAEKLSAINELNITLNRGLAALTLIDPLMKETPGYFKKLTKLLSEKEINIEMISSSQASIQVVIKEDKLKIAADALVSEFDLFAA